ncbi:MAG TPA: cyclase family protein [Actinoplanes sp.]|nr:cyclase family protein [Actinoplanes sp.]
MLQYRAEFDVTVTFLNGGGLQAQRFRVDVPHADVTRAELGALFVASCGLLMVGHVELSGVRIFAEPHKGTRGGPSDATAGPPRPPAPTTFVELSHVISAGMVTYPGLPGPEFSEHLSRAGSRAIYAAGTEFTIGRISMVSNTGTYLDSPFHRYADGTDLAGLPLERLADLPAVVVRTAGSGIRAVDVGALAALDVAGRAVLLHTGGDRHWGTPEYAVDAPYLTEAGATWLVGHGAALVGIDAVNIDDISPACGGRRPAHSALLAAGIPIVEHLTGLANLPPTGARFTATPPRVAAFGTFPVRAFAAVPAVEPHDHLRSGGWLPTTAG